MRGGSHFLCRRAAAKKVTKESGLTPPILDRYPRALNFPILRAATNWATFVASAPIKCLTRVMHPRFGQRHRISCAHLRQTLCRPSRHKGKPSRSDALGCIYTVRALPCAVRQPT
jgi:hypothetical protein